MLFPDPELIYHDAFLLVVNKPAGMLAVPGRGKDKQDCVFARIQKEFSDALIVHRLDMATSGLLVFARGTEMQRRLSRLFHDRKIQKCYVAVVVGRVDPEVGEINLPLIGDWPNRPKQKVDHEFGKPSLTRYRVLNRDEHSTRLELEPSTGRTHQLRVHLATIGHPIVGDELYGGRATARMLLHAQLLNFFHPFSGEPMSFACEPPF